jgi:predicted metal-binding membrane protein
MSAPAQAGPAGGTLVVAAVYELTPLKDVCLGKCRSPLGSLLGSWRDGPSGALQMGARNGAWCVGCCWALMASLFALEVMSVTWMAVVAGLIAFGKTIPWRRVASSNASTSTRTADADPEARRALMECSSGRAAGGGSTLRRGLRW